MRSVPQKFSVTSGRSFHGRKLPIRDYLAVIALFCNGVKGVAALRMARDMNINPKSAFVLLHKLREAMGVEIASGAELAGTVEVDGAYFGQGPKQANRKANRVDRRTAQFPASGGGCRPRARGPMPGPGLSARKATACQ